MAFLPYNFDTNLQYLQGGGQQNDQVKELTQTPAESPQGTTTPVAGGGQQAAATPSTQTTTQTAPDTATVGTVGTAIDRLFNPLRQGLQAGGEQIKNLGTAFQQAAGPQETYQSGNVQNVLQQAIQPNATPEVRTQAKGYVGAQYTGPTGLDADQLAALNEALNRVYTSNEAMKTSTGLSTLTRQAYPGTSIGEAQFNAEDLLQDPSFLQERAALQGTVGATQADVTAQTQAATDYATQRAQQEADIAAQSKAYLTGQKSGIENQWTQAANAALAQQQATQAQWDAINAGGAVPADIAAQFNNPNDVQAKAAQTQWQSIMDKYKDIADVPLLVPGMDSRGREVLYLPADYYAKHPELQPTGDLLSSTDIAGLAAGNKQSRVVARQRELEKYFSPTGYLPGTETARGPGAYLQLGAKPEYQQYMPMYGAGTTGTTVPTWQSPEVQNYLSFDPGNLLAGQNNWQMVTTQDQADRYNEIEDLLGESDQMTKSGEPLRAAMINTDVERYINDEKTSLDQWDKLPTQAMMDWSKALDKLNSHIKKAKTQNLFSKIIGGPGPPLGLPGSETFANMLARTVYPAGANPGVPAAPTSKLIQPQGD